MRAAELLVLLLALAAAPGGGSAEQGGLPAKKLRMAYATGPLLKFQIWRVFEEYMRVISQRYPDIRIEGENYLPQPIYSEFSWLFFVMYVGSPLWLRLAHLVTIPVTGHIASFLSVFKLVLIGLIIVGKDPFAFFGMQAPSIWQWGQENKVYACMMVFFLSNMIENQCMSTGAFEITLNDVPVWSKLESGHLPSMQQLVQILDNEMKLNVHMESMPPHRS